MPGQESAQYRTLADFFLPLFFSFALAGLALIGKAANTASTIIPITDCSEVVLNPLLGMRSPLTGRINPHYE